MTDLPAALSRAASVAFEAAGLDPALGRVTPADRPDLADFQCNGALAGAKAARRNPRVIAQQVADRLAASPLVSSVEVAGPGFINLRVTAEALSERASALSSDPRAGAGHLAQPRRVIVDYGGPNVAKEMHVGHLRASIIGEAIKRLHRFRGDETLGDAHFGDWGFQMGLLLAACADADPQVAALIDEIDALGGPMPEQLKAKVGETLSARIGLDDLDRLYPAAAARAREDEAFRDRARRATAELQAGRAGYLALWRHFASVTRAALQRDFHAIGVDFDLWRGESDVDPLIPRMVEDLREKGLLEADQGAQIVRVARQGDKREIPPLLVVSSEGSAMYGTTDLATIVDRRASFDPQLVLYVVDQRQADHFEIVFRAAELAGWASEGALRHIGFGTMNGPDGKPFKTRAGGVLKLRDLIDMAETKAKERLREADLGAELDPQRFELTAHQVAVATLKFADLINHRSTSYVFDLDRFSSFEGRTGPYLLYQAVRVKSLLRRAAAADGVAAAGIVIEAPAERDLALVLESFDRTLAEAYDKSAPNLIADHAYRLAQSFSRFYAACPVLSAQPEHRGSRLALAALTLKQLEIALDLLGMEIPEQM